jgi:hypothetical protein
MRIEDYTQKKEDLAEVVPLQEVTTDNSTYSHDTIGNVPKDMHALDAILSTLHFDRTDSDSEGIKETYLANINSSTELSDLIEKNPDYFEHLFDLISQKIYSPAELTSLAYNFKERLDERAKNDTDTDTRIRTEPRATDSEYQLGTYAEAIESQVREAVFSLLEKGYTPMESGFYDLREGSQYIGLSDTDNTVVETLRESLSSGSHEVTQKLTEMHVALDIQKMDDRIQIILIPQNDMLSLEAWEEVWTSVALSIPTNPAQFEATDVHSTGQGMRFREQQDRIRAGKNTWLGPGLAFVDGNVVSISYQDFKKLE